MVLGRGFLSERKDNTMYSEVIKYYYYMALLLVGKGFNARVGIYWIKYAGIGFKVLATIHYYYMTLLLFEK